MSKPVSKRRLQQDVAKRAATADNVPVPTPFQPLPDALKPFVDVLDTSHVYITHLDIVPWQLKRRVFLVPVVLNLTILAFLALRAYTVLPTYLALLVTILGYDSPTTVDLENTTRQTQLSIVLSRTLMVAIDYFLVRVVLQWPITFFFDTPASPVSWRWNIGFQDTEIVVRKSRKWFAEDLFKSENVAVTNARDNAFFKVRVAPAIDRTKIVGKTGYVLMDKDWDLDFNAIITAMGLVKEGQMRFEQFQKTVIAHTESHGWLFWPVHREEMGDEEDARKRLVAFKERLDLLGKENIFFRWIEILQYESSQPGGFTVARRDSAVKKLRRLFLEESLEYGQFIEALGGEVNLPGVEQAG